MRPHGDGVERKLLGTTANGLKQFFPPPPTTLPILPVELTIEILLRLPVRSLLQLSSVCKSWKAIISSAQFAKDHLQRSLMDPTMTHLRLASSDDRDSCKIRFCSIQSLFENPSAPAKVVCFRVECCYPRIVGSCNGLLCLHDVLHHSVRLWNPCTGLESEWLRIEPAKDVRVAYDGFGYDHVHDEYKLLVVAAGSGEIVTQVCTFGTNSWKTIQDFPFPPDDWSGEFVSGTLNWIARVPGATNRWVILSIDLGKETHSQVSLPHVNDENLRKPALRVLRNCLCVCLEDKKPSHWVVWLMKEYGVELSWTKLVMIRHVELGPYIIVGSLEPLYISENDVLLARSPCSKLVLYNSNGGMLNCPVIEHTDGRYFHIYQESLVSPSHYGLRSRFSRLIVD